MGGNFDGDMAVLARAQHGLVHRRDALAAGTEEAIRYRLRTGHWTEVQRFVYRVGGAPETHRQRLLAAVLAGPEGSVASHRASAALAVIPGYPESILEITCPRRTAATERLHDVRRHYTTLLPDHHRKTLDAIPSTTVGRTLFDLCAVVHPGRAARAVDNCLARKWVTVPALWRVLDDLAIQGRNGTCALREILLDRGEGYVAPASELERRFMQVLREARLALPARELDLGDADQWIGRVEFVYRAERVLIEVDSRLHHSALLDFEHDRDRDNRFVAAGFRVLRVTYEMLHERPREVVNLVKRALKAAA
jgi:very-short-patch-repair endonuclease